jgi:RNA polymerase sigma factor (sigma-70 family)
MTPASETREDRFESLFRSNRTGILTYFLRRVAAKPDAADLLAETFVIAWRKIEKIPADDAGRLWLYGVARRLLANYFRHERVETALAGDLRERIGLQVEHRIGLESVPFEDVIAGSLDTLSAADREIIELSAWEQLTPTEIAGVVGIKAGTARVRLHRIRRTLACHLISAGYPATTDADCAG